MGLIAAGRLREEEAAPSPSGAELGGCTVATVADGGIANGHPEGPMTGRKIAKSPRDPPRQRRSPETVFLILSHLFTQHVCVRHTLLGIPRC